MSKKLSIKQLESRLQDLDGFDDPKVKLEQYATPPHIAALLLTTIDQTYDDIDDKLIADLGCGTGRLTIGSVLCGAKMVFGFDIDQSALKSALDNVGEFFGDDDSDSDTCENAYKHCENFNLIQVDIAASNCDKFWQPWHKFFDTVIMNPPYGTKQNSGLDIKFLERAIEISRGTVYSLHKSSTRNVSFFIGKISFASH